MRSKAITILAMMLGSAVIAVSPAILAQQETKSPSPAQETSKKDSQVLGKANYYKQDWGPKKVTLLKGSVSFTHEDTVLTSEQVEYEGKTKTAVSPGPLKINNPECDIVGDKGSAYFNKRLGLVEGNVVMNVRPKRDELSKDDKDNGENIDNYKAPTTVTCDRLEYFYKKKIASATGGVVFKQDKRTATASKAVYDLKNEVLTLEGNVKAIDEDGQTFTAPGKVVFSLKKGNEWMEAPNATASFRIDLDEDEEE